VLSSTSSSNQRLPHLAWLSVLGTALIALLLWVTAMEAGLSVAGYRASVLDSEPLWLKERARADSLGDQALILVGGSRMQLDIDQDVLRRETGLEPVQLALNGSPFISVLRGLAADKLVKGTLLVDFEDKALSPDDFYAHNKFESDAERLEGQFNIPDFSTLDATLSGLLHGHLRSYADNARPITTLWLRLIYRDGSRQYLFTLPDRSTLADYQRVSMPAFYYQRTSINLGLDGKIPAGSSDAEIQSHFRKIITALKPSDDSFYRQHIQEIAAMTAAIRARGGRVIFVIFPESGYVKEIDDRLYPRPQFWEPFAASIGTQTLNFEDNPVLSEFICPDGSHLDYRQRASFTDALVNALNLRQKDLTNSR
jgi:hypothetical protein